MNCSLRLFVPAAAAAFVMAAAVGVGASVGLRGLIVAAGLVFGDSVASAAGVASVLATGIFTAASGGLLQIRAALATAVDGSRS